MKEIKEKIGKMFESKIFVGILYATLSILIVKFIFSGDIVQVKYSGWLVVLFCVIFSFPFMYFLIKNENR